MPLIQLKPFHFVYIVANILKKTWMSRKPHSFLQLDLRVFVLRANIWKYKKSYIEILTVTRNNDQSQIRYSWPAKDAPILCLITDAGLEAKRKDTACSNAIHIVVKEPKKEILYTYSAWRQYPSNHSRHIRKEHIK